MNDPVTVCRVCGRPLLGPPLLHARSQRTALGVDGHHIIEGTGIAAARERGPHEVGVTAYQAQVEQRSSSPRNVTRPGTSGAPGLVARTGSRAVTA